MRKIFLVVLFAMTAQLYAQSIVPSSGNNAYTLCSGVLYDAGGPFGQYSNGLNGYTVLYPSNPGNMIQLSGTTAGENCCDFIRIYNGVGLGGNLLWAGVAGSGTIPTITSTSGPLTVSFSSDGSGVGNGFALNINCVAPVNFVVPVAGNNAYTVCSGVLYDAGGPTSDYNNNSNGYTVLNPSNPGNMVRVSGTTVGDSCCDSIRIYNGTGLGGNLLWAGVAGAGAIPPITSTVGALTVQFTSNGNTVGAGFALDINCVPFAEMSVPASGNNAYTVCSGVLYDAGGAFGQYSNGLNGYTVLYPSNPGNMVQLSGTTAGENCCDFIRIYNGVGLGGNLLWAGVAGSGTIPTITSTSGPLTVSFSSDGSGVGNGFALNINCVAPVDFVVPVAGNNAYTVCSGVLYDAGGPTSDYSNNANGYTVLNPSNPGNMVRVSGTTVGESCCDSIRIYNGTGLGGNLLWAGVAGAGAIPPITSTVGPLTVQFTSNGSTVGAGFALDINCVPFAEMSVPASGNNAYTVCSGALYDAGGSFGQYSNGLNGYTVLYPSNPGNMVRVSGTTAGENCCDYIRIYNGVGLGGNLLWAGVAGSGTIPTITSTSGPLTVSFSSDGSGVGNGFALNINCVAPVDFVVPVAGNNAYTVCSGVLYDAGGPTSDYSNNANGYTVLNPSNPGNMVRVSGTTVGESCCDFIRIYNGTGLGGNLLWAGVAGAGAIPPITSTVGALTVQFTSNGSTVGAGFALDINCVPFAEMSVPASGNNAYTVCSGALYDAGGSFGQYSNGLNGYTVLYPSNPGNMVRVSGTTAGENCCDYIRIYNGVGLGGNLLWAGVAGSGTIPTITSTSGPLTVSFSSDGSGVGNGFALNINCISNPNFSVLNETICQGDSILFAGTYLYLNGVYYDTLQNANNTDSIVRLNLTVQNASNTTINQVIYTGQSYNFAGNIYTNSGTYTTVLTNIAGCDSIVTLNLSVIAPCATATSIACGQSISGSTLGKPSVWSSYSCTSWNESGPEDIYTFTLSQTTDVFIGLSGMSVDLDAMVLTSCTNTCIAAIHNSATLTLSAGTYYIVVDGYRGVAGNYTLTFRRNPTNPVASIQSLSGTSVCKNELVNFVASNASFGSAIVNYQWKKNGINVGANSRYYSSVNNDGDIIVCEISVQDGCVNTILVSNALNMTVRTYNLFTSNQAICQGETYLFNGNTYTTSGTYIDTVFSSSTCDEIRTLNLTVLNTVTPIITISTANTTVCSNNTVIFTSTISGGGFSPSREWRKNGFVVGYGAIFTTSNLNNGDVITCRLTSSSGCASPSSTLSNAITINVLPINTSTITASICQGDEYDFNGTKYVAQGSYSQVFTGSNGCDSIVTLNLTVYPTTQSIFAGICTGQTYNFNGNTILSAGIYKDTLVSSQGCDSIVTLNLTVSDTIFITRNESICVGSSYFFGNQNRTVSGTYIDTLISAAGCDSVVTLNLSVFPNYNVIVFDTICQGTPYNFAGTNLTASGIYSHNYYTTNGCDSIIQLNLFVKSVLNNTITHTMCQGSQYAFAGNILTLGGVYHDTTTNQNGCDSITTLTLNVVSNYIVNTNHSICAGAIYNFNGQLLTTAGTYTTSLQTQFGCDSIITLNLTIKQPTTATITQASCTSFTLNGTTYTNSGTYTQNRTNAAGCDSIITLNLTIKQPTTATITQASCTSFTLNGTTYTNSGTYTQNRTNAAGCDSIITLNLTIKQPTTATITQASCTSFTLNGTTYTASGTYTQNRTNAAGCDSIITLNFTRNQPTSATITQASCTSFTLNGTTYTASGTYTQNRTNTAGCDSTITLNLTIKQPTSATITQASCTSFTLNGTTYTSSGTYTQNRTNAAGCDSTITLNLTIKQPTSATITQASCTSFTLNGTTYTSSGTYTQNRTNTVGCDSTITLNLTIKQPTSATITQASCTSFTLNGTTYSSSGTYTQNRTNAAGCDSTITLNLTINALPSLSITQSGTTLQATAGYTAYVWSLNGTIISGATNSSHTATANGDYGVTVTDANGCQNTATINYTASNVGEISSSDFVKIFPNPSEGIVNINFSQAGTKTIHIYDNLGRLIYQNSTDELENQIYLHELPSGVYQVQIIQSNAQITKSLIIAK